MKVSSGVGSLFLVEDCEVASDVFSDAADLGELSGASRGGLCVSEGSEFFLEFLDVCPDGLGVAVSNLFINLFFDHGINIKLNININ